MLLASVYRNKHDVGIYFLIDKISQLASVDFLPERIYNEYIIVRGIMDDGKPSTRSFE
jgi:hypothetical protein